MHVNSARPELTLIHDAQDVGGVSWCAPECGLHHATQANFPRPVGPEVARGVLITCREGALIQATTHAPWINAHS